MRPRRRSLLVGPAAAPAVALASGAALIAAVFLPWYAANVGEVFSAGTASGVHATRLAWVVLVLGIAITLAALLLVADIADLVPLEQFVADALGWVLLVGAAAAGLLVAYRLVWPPGQADLLTRDLGLYLGLAAAVGGIVAGISQLAQR